MNQFNCCRICFSTPEVESLSSLFERSVEKFEAVSGIDVKIKFLKFSYNSHLKIHISPSDIC